MSSGAGADLSGQQGGGGQLVLSAPGAPQKAVQKITSGLVKHADATLCPREGRP